MSPQVYTPKKYSAAAKVALAPSLRLGPITATAQPNAARQLSESGGSGKQCMAIRTYTGAAYPEEQKTMNTMTPSKNPIRREHVTLKDGRIVSLFVNRDTNLIVLDIVDANEKGGIEVYRHNV